MIQSAVFALNQVGCDFGAITALQNVSLNLERGRTTALVGASGSGKSTLLKLLLRLLDPDRGDIAYENEPLATLNPLELRRQCGYVIQEGGLFPHLSGRDNVALMARHLGWEPARIDQRVTTLADMVRLPLELLNRPPAELSGGQRQRVGLMRALMLDPPVLLLDEPLGALDPITRDHLQEQLGDLFKRLNKTVVLVTHDLAEAARLAHHLVLLHAGSVLQSGPPRQIIEQPASDYAGEFVRSQQGPERWL